MKAAIQRRTTDQKVNADLKTVAPLVTPFVLMVDPASNCNFQCKFCPTGDRDLIKATRRYQGTMDFNIFAKLIDDLKDFPEPIKVLRLYKEGEPLLNKHFPAMVQYARASPHIQRIDTTTNGVLLNPKLNEQLIDAGLDQINISINGINVSQYKNYTGAKINFATLLENIKHLYSIRDRCEIYIKAIKDNMSTEDQKTFYDLFGEMSDRIFLENLSPAWPNFVFKDIPMRFVGGHYGQEVIERLVCPFIFYIMVVNSDGSVSSCVQDWERKLIVGSVTTQSLRQIWTGSQLNTHRIRHLEGLRKKHPTCAVCDVMSFGVLENIDSNRENILKKLVEHPMMTLA